ncbi:MAG: hypothetical protein NVS9B9_10330 [Ktedonobacteraceae bacterium]
MQDRIEYLQDKGFKLRPESNKKDNYIMECPQCLGMKLSVKGDTGAYHCWDAKCAIKGSFYNLCQLLAIPFPGGKDTVKDIVLSSAEIEAILDNPQADIAAAKRGLRVESWRMCGAGADPVSGASIFMYFWEGKMLGMKYKIQDGPIRIEGKEPPLYVPHPKSFKENDYVVVVEGEEDAITLIECGVHAVATMGASKEKGFQFLRRFKTIFIGYDSDPAGDEGASKMAEALGSYRCRRVKWPEKDVNDWYRMGATADEVQKVISESERFPSQTILQVDELTPVDSSKLVKYAMGWKCLDSLTNGFYGGQLTAIQAEAGTGKTTFMSNLLVNQIANKIPVGFASLEEHPVFDVHPKMKGIVLGKNPSLHTLSEQDHSKANRLLKDKLYYFDTKNGCSHDAVCKWIHDVYHRGVRVVGIDHFHLMVENEESINNIGSAIVAVRDVVRCYPDLHIFLIIQPKALAPSFGDNPAQQPGLRTLRGGAAISQAIDNLLIITNGGEDITVYRYEKVRSHGRVSQKHWRGKEVRLYFDHDSLSMCE